MSAVSGRALLDLVYPRWCAGCGRPATDSFLYLCWDCVAATPMIGPPFCSLCGDPADGVVEHDFTCSWCRREEPAFTAARSAARYRGVLRKVLLNCTAPARTLVPSLHVCRL